MKKISILFIEIYQKTVSRLLLFYFGKGCRFLPTCSDYTKEAIEKFGIVKGWKLGLKRISRCHPFGESGFDPVSG